MRSFISKIFLGLGHFFITVLMLMGDQKVQMKFGNRVISLNKEENWTNQTETFDLDVEKFTLVVFLT